MAALLIVFSTCTSLMEGLFIKRYNSKHTKGGFFFTALLSFFSMLFFVLTDKDGFLLPRGILLYGIMAGLLYCCASFLTYVALNCGSFAISMLILSYSIVFSIIYGLFFLNESATVFTYVGLMLILLSLCFVHAPSMEEKDKIHVTPKWVICIGISVVCSGLFGVIQRIQQIRYNDSCTNEFMVIALGLSTMALFVMGLFKNHRDFRYILHHGLGWTLCAGTANGITNALALIINTLLPLSIASPMRAGAKILMSYLLSKLFLGEKFMKRQEFGVLLGAIALVLLNI